jgi:ligand-binding sensor domain-containing protein
MKYSYLYYIPFFATISLFVIFSSCSKDDSNSGNKFPIKKVNSIIIDKQSVVWAGTDIGLISYWNNEWKSFEELNTGEVFDISMVNAGTVSGTSFWLATSMGAQLAEYKSDVILSASLFTSTSSGLEDNNISAVLNDALDVNWFATSSGLSYLNQNIWYFHDEFGDLKLYPVISMAAKSDGWIFAGTTGLGVGRFKYNPADADGITGASYYNMEWSGLPSDTILSIYIDGNNNQWFGTPNGVAYHEVWETKKGWKVYTVKDGLINNRVQAISGDTAGHIWFGTAAGVSYFNGLTWENYNETDGLINPKVNDIAIDANGTIWFATDSGISVLEGTHWKSFSK